MRELSAAGDRESKSLYTSCLEKKIYFLNILH